MRIVIAPLICLVSACGPSAAQLEEVKAILARGEAEAKARDDRFVMTGHDKIVVGKSPCTTPPVTWSTSRFARELAQWMGYQSVSPGPLPSFAAEGITVARSEEQLSRLRSSVSKSFREEAAEPQKRKSYEYKDLSGKELIARATELANLPTAPELVIVLAAAVDPKMHEGDKSFDAGAAVGRAYAWDPGSGKIVCAGEVAAQSSSSVTTLKSLPGAMLNHDLYKNLIADAQTSLHALQ